MDAQPNAEPESPDLGATASEEGEDQARSRLAEEQQLVIPIKCNDGTSNAVVYFLL